MQPSLDPQANQVAMDAGQLYWAFTNELIAERRRGREACRRVSRQPQAQEVIREIDGPG